MVSLKNILWVLLFIFVACNKGGNISNGKQSTSIDSLWDKILKARESESKNEAFKNVIVLYWSVMTKSEKDFNYLCQKIEIESNESDDPDWKQSLYLLKGWYYGVHSQNAKSEKYLNMIQTSNLEINLSKIQQLAFLKYTTNQIDSAINHYNRGYQLAKEANNKNWMLNYSNNLGTVYHEIREYNLASKYFKEAMGYSQELKMNVPMLINNIITCALGVDGSDEAYELYEKYKNVFQSEIPYELAIYKINYSNILMKKNRIAEAEKVLDDLNVENLGENVKTIFDIQMAHLYLVKHAKLEFESLFLPYKSMILKNPEFLLALWHTIVLDAIKANYVTFTSFELNQLYNAALKNQNPRFIEDVLELMFETYKSTSQREKWEILLLKSKLESAKTNSINFQNDMLMNFKLNSLGIENAKIKLQSELTHSQNYQYMIMFFGSIIVLILLGVLLLFYAKNRKIEVEKLKLEISNSRNINEINKNKRIFADRLIGSNQAMTKKIHQIVKAIQKSNFAKEPEMIQIRKDLTALMEIEHDLELEMDQLKASDVLTYYSNQYTCIHSMNQTEKTILSYLLNGQKIKEISALLSVSEQHVRNTKTRVMKLINAEGQTQLTLEDLIALRNEISI